MKRLERIKNDKGFIAALDQSGGSTPKALLVYRVKEDSYKDETKMRSVIKQANPKGIEKIVDQRFEVGK